MNFDLFANPAIGGIADHISKMERIFMYGNDVKRRIYVAAQAAFATILLAIPVLSSAQMTIPPDIVWADNCAVPGYLKSGQAVCDARRRQLYTLALPSLTYSGGVDPTGQWFEAGYCAYGTNTYSFPVLGFLCPPNFSATPNTNGFTCGLTPLMTTYNRATQTCVRSVNTADPGKNPDCKDCGKGNPIYPGFGNKMQRETDLTAHGDSPLRMIRVYNSHHPDQQWNREYAPGTSRFGNSWSSTYEKSISVSNGAGLTVASIAREDSKRFYFTLTNGTWTPEADVTDKLERLVDGGNNLIGWRYTLSASDDIEFFDSVGRLQSITSRAGIVQNLVYSDGTANGPNGGVIVGTTTPLPIGLLLSVTDSFGKQLGFGYDVMSRVRVLTDPAGGTYQYAYDAANNLVTVTTPDNRTRTYVYNEHVNTANIDRPNALTGIIDENSSRYATFKYNNVGRAVSTEHTGTVNPVNQYTSTTTGPYFNATVVDPLGMTSTYEYVRILGVVKTSKITRPCSTPGCSGPVSSDISYDVNGNVNGRKDFNGNLACYTFDGAGRNLETSRMEALGGANCTTPTFKTESRRAETDWHTSLRIPIAMREYKRNGSLWVLLRTTSYIYDGNNGAANPKGNVTTKSIKDEVNNVTRTWNYNSYDAYGRVGTIDGPRTDVADTTTYEYYDNDSSQGNKRGMLWKTTNALGHVTEFTDYDAHGRVTAMKDPNLLITTMSYWPRGWLQERNVGGGPAGEKTKYDYDNVGQLIRITLPDSSLINYGYDAAHRLFKISDGADIDGGNRITYGLDNMGNRTTETAHDPSGALARKSKREIDSFNRLWKTYAGAETNFDGYATELIYDANGNLLTSKDPLNRTTTNGYDGLNRLASMSVPAQVVTDPAHVTNYEYDAQDNLTKVTEPATPHPSGTGTWRRDTIYTYNGFNEITQLVSKDTGTTLYTYDAAGNLATKIDARNICATYAYDALNRVTSVKYAATCYPTTPTESVTYTYDTPCLNGKGHLCSFTNKVGTTTTSDTSYSYDLNGRVTAKTQVVDGVTQTVGYQYNGFGQLSQVILPSNGVIGYTYSNNRVRSVTITPNGIPATTTIAGCVDYEPFGPVSDWKWGTTDCQSTANQHIRLFDLDGRVSQIAGGINAGASRFTYDTAARLNAIESLTALNGTVDPTKSFTYGYADPFDRLTSQTPGTGNTAQTIGYGYDGIGNRRTLTTSAAPPGLVNDSLIITYGADNRPTQFQSALTGLTQVKINALGQRVKKESATGGVTRFVYDEAGRLLGEYDATGQPVMEHVWLNDLPVAVFRNGGVFHVHTDQLGTPRKVVYNTTGAVAWRWDNADAFGNNAANELMAIPNAPFKYNLRFPGQYYDAETGVNYNYFRDYDPATGRYVESDPIGLRGGLNTYAYVSSSPLKLFDPKGLKSRVCCKGIAFGIKHCYVETQNSEGRSTLGLVGGPYLDMPGCGQVLPDNGFDKGGTCGDWTDDCTTDQCVKDNAALYPNPSKYSYLSSDPNSNSFASEMAKFCKLKRPNLKDWETPGWGGRSPPVPFPGIPQTPPGWPITCPKPIAPPAPEGS